MKNLTTSTMKLFTVLLVGGGLMLSGLTGEALANDAKRYPGAMCKPVNLIPSSPKPWTAPAHGYGSGGINNNSSQNLYVDCPVVRDNTTNTNGLKLWSVVGTNRKGKDKLWCTMLSRDSKTGKTLGYKTVFMPFLAVDRQLSAYGPKVSRKYSGSFYQLRCKIPPISPYGTSSLRSYYVEED